MGRPLGIGLLALALASCQGPEPRPAPAPGTARPPGQARPQGQAPPQAASPLARPQFTFASWSQAVGMIKDGKVIQTVTGKGGFSLILEDHTWVRILARPGDPLPGNPKEYVVRNAPNARAIKHSRE